MLIHKAILQKMQSIITWVKSLEGTQRVKMKSSQRRSLTVSCHAHLRVVSNTYNQENVQKASQKTFAVATLLVQCEVIVFTRLNATYTTLQSMTSAAKLSQLKFRHCQENGIVLKFPTIPQSMSEFQVGLPILILTQRKESDLKKLAHRFWGYRWKRLDEPHGRAKTFAD